MFKGSMFILLGFVAGSTLFCAAAVKLIRERDAIVGDLEDENKTLRAALSESVASQAI